MADISRQLSGYEIVKRVLATLGLGVPNSVASSSDTMTVQIWALLTECGQNLLGEYEWQWLQKTHTINTVPGTLIYPVPGDLDRFLNMSAWNKTSMLPLGGPLSGQSWSFLQARQLGGSTLQLQFTIRGDELIFYSVPATPQVLAIEYQSRGWVRDATNPATFKDFMEGDGDVCLYDPQLIISYLKYKWREAKGFETSALERAYLKALAAAQAKDSPGVDLPISTRQSSGLIGGLNLPVTGYGN